MITMASKMWIILSGGLFILIISIVTIFLLKYIHFMRIVLSGAKRNRGS